MDDKKFDQIRQIGPGEWLLDGAPWLPKIQGFRFAQQELDGSPIGEGYAFVQLVLSGISEDAARRKIGTPSASAIKPVGKGK